MPVEEAIGLGEEPAITDEADDPPGVLPESAQEVGHHRLERLEGAKGLVTNTVFELIPKLFDRVSAPGCRTVRRSGARWPARWPARRAPRRRGGSRPHPTPPRGWPPA